MILQETLSYRDVAILPNYCPFDSRKDVDTSVVLGKVSWGNKEFEVKLDIPIVSSPMDTITDGKFAKEIAILGGLGLVHRFNTIEEQAESFNKAVTFFHDLNYRWEFNHKLALRVGCAIGANVEKDLERAEHLYEVGCRIFCVDVAHGHSKFCGNMVKALREKFGKSILIIAGSICTAQGADFLVGCDADVIRSGNNNGSVCSTALATGTGCGQLTTIMECSKAAKPIIADGSIKSGGDIAKALVAGAKVVMCGGIFAGCDETPGEASDGLKTYRGMASKEAYEDMYGQMPDYKTAEGVSISIPVKGPLKRIVDDLMGGLRSAMTYVGANNLDELYRRGKFVRLTEQAYKDAMPSG